MSPVAPEINHSVAIRTDSKMHLLLTCEHAGNQVPAPYRKLFRHAKTALNSHRGWDPGSLAMAKTFQSRLAAPLFYTKVTRLLVEPNRSLRHRHLFSEFTRPLDDAAKEQILQKYYHPHRNHVEAWIEDRVGRGQPVVHLSCHTFTPKFNGQRRNADVGLLYDPLRTFEKAFCDRWHKALLARCPALRIRRNYPYLGKADGLTTHLRRRFQYEQYLGIELEVNQRQLTPTSAWRSLRNQLAETLADAFGT